MTQRHKPKGAKGQRRQLQKQKQLTAAEVRKAMLEASKAIDELSQELNALRRVLIAERAQVIYYTEMALGYSKRTIVEPVLKGFLQLTEEQRMAYTKQAVQELSSETGEEKITPHKGVLLTDGETVQ